MSLAITGAGVFGVWLFLRDARSLALRVVGTMTTQGSVGGDSLSCAVSGLCAGGFEKIALTCFEGIDPVSVRV